MSALRTIIIEDYEHWINDFHNCLSGMKEIEIVGIAKNKKDAIHLIQQQQPDLVLLDIELPHEGEGFEILETLENTVNFDIIITTAHAKSEYMMRYGVLNSVLQHSLIKILFKQEFQLNPNLLAERIQSIIQNRRHLQYQQKRKAALKCLRTNINSDGQEKNILCDWEGEEQQSLPLKDILYLQSDKNYNDIFTVHQKIKTIRGSLSEIAVELEAYNFFRIHKSYLINLTFLKKVRLSNTRKTKGSGGEIYLSPSSSSPLPLARPQRKRFINQLLLLNKQDLIF